jgi:asparagine synthase (glutamine-hydrolysing)
MVRYDGAPVSSESLAPMAAAMSFWGPDGHGQWCGDGAGLGHLLLHVTPESLHERLPASIRTAPHLVITADARIDNREELFDVLSVPRLGREQTPDSSLILLAYERWGADCVERLLGDFAFAIHDARERRLFCARDPFGCKPFIYHLDGKRFVFASDVRGALALVDSPRLNEPLLAAYLQMKTYHAEKRLTFFEEIVKLPPAHTLTLTAAGVRISRYWSPEDAPAIRLATDEEYAEQMRNLFGQAVECRLRSAFPVGSHLSGGLDSSAITVLAARIQYARGREIGAFSWSPPPGSGADGGRGDEHLRIGSVCRAENLTCRYLPVTRQNYFDWFRQDFTVEPTEMMAREGNVQLCAAAEGRRVMLSGWGGDEAVSGRAASALAEFFAGRRWPDFRALVESRMDAPDGNSGVVVRARKLAGVLRDIATPHLADSLYSLFYSDIWLEHRSPCIEPTFARLHRKAVRELRGPAYRPQPAVRSSICHLLDYGHLSGRLEDWATSGAAHRLVYRYPLLDRRLVEFTLGVPAIQLCKIGQRPALFRRSVSELLPASGYWDRRKAESTAIRALKTAYFDAHVEWAEQIDRQMAESPLTRLVDLARLRKAVRARGGYRDLTGLSGVREAFGCFAMGKQF